MSNNNSEVAVNASIFSIISNLGLTIIKFLGGYFGNSYALIADAIESSVDVVSSIFVFFGIKYSSRPADENHPYGHGKAEALITFVVVFLVVALVVLEDVVEVVVFGAVVVVNVVVTGRVASPFLTYDAGDVLITTCICDVFSPSGIPFA